MKQILLLVTILCSAGCSDFLKKEPLDQLTEASFFQTEADVQRAIIGCYSVMQDIEYSGKDWMITEIPSDNSQAGGLDPDFTPIDNFTVTPDNQPIGNYWAVRYRQITLSNSIIEKTEAMDLTQARKDVFQAEVRFLRAIAYFDLVRVYGGVPLITKAPVYGDDLLYPRSKVSEVYAMIVADLEFAAEHLPLRRSGSEVGRATKGAANGYLAKVSLTNRDFLKARDAAKRVIDSGVYDLMPEYGDLFELATCDNNIESLFEVQFAGCGPFGTGNPRQAFFAPWGSGITKDRDGWGSQIPTAPATNNPGTTIVDAYKGADKRKHPTVMTAGQSYPTINANDGGFVYPAAGLSAAAVNIKKFVVGAGANICFMSTPQNFPLMRYADVLLTYAEAIMEIEGGVSSNAAALAAFNRVRTRAGMDALTTIDKEIMLNERRLEFAFEGHRWFDIIRSGKAIEILLLHGKNPQNHHLLFPIPVGEIQINPKLEQNPGY